MIAIGADHGGYKLKEEVKRFLEEKGIEVKDFGTYSEVCLFNISVPVNQIFSWGKTMIFPKGIAVGITFKNNQSNFVYSLFVQSR